MSDGEILEKMCKKTVRERLTLSAHHGASSRIVIGFNWNEIISTERLRELD